MNIHKGLKPFKCKLGCLDVAFASSANLAAKTSLCQTNSRCLPFKDPGEAIRHQTIKLIGGVVYQIAVGEPYSVQQFLRLFASINTLNSSQDFGGGACEVSYLNTK